MRFQKRRAQVFTLIAFGCLLAWPNGARAQQTCSSQTVEDGCLQEAATEAGINHLVCTANDVKVTKITSTTTQTCTPGQEVTFTGTLTVESNASGRYDIGAYIASDGGDALTGSCSISTVPC